MDPYQPKIPILPHLICLGWPKTEAYNDAVAFLQLEPSFRPRFSKYSKPKSGIGPGSLKTDAKEGYRPWSSRTRSQKVAGSQGVQNSQSLLPPRAASAIPLSLSPRSPSFTFPFFLLPRPHPAPPLGWHGGGHGHGCRQALRTVRIWLAGGCRPRFSKYSKPKSGIGPGSLKTDAKEGYRPWSRRTRSQKVAGSQGVQNSQRLLPPRAASAIPLSLSPRSPSFTFPFFLLPRPHPAPPLGWHGGGHGHGCRQALRTVRIWLAGGCRPRFSKYSKPKSGIGPGSLKTDAKEGYRPWSRRTRSQKVAGSQGVQNSQRLLPPRAASAIPLSLSPRSPSFTFPFFLLPRPHPAPPLGWHGGGHGHGCRQALRTVRIWLAGGCRPRFSKYSKPKSGIGPGSLKTDAKEGYRPWSRRTRSQKVAGSQGVQNSQRLLPPRAASAIPLSLSPRSPSFTFPFFLLPRPHPAPPLGWHGPDSVERDAVASMEVGRGYGSLQICRHHGLLFDAVPSHQGHRLHKPLPVVLLARSSSSPTQDDDHSPNQENGVPCFTSPVNLMSPSCLRRKKLFAITPTFALPDESQL
ncbi:hypothetical protein DEO72_LG8g2116 [Vigna unguiculata]|uniref:Uncharacterized protein n=1 Tax=Vigna unguiculata TaxID=3917 RepID=A0A4D6MRR0_VIGUN|nr:hypothetical protein DEO72_LG8g2116 [Vigna unguiculata]